MISAYAYQYMDSYVETLCFKAAFGDKDHARMIN